MIDSPVLAGTICPLDMTKVMRFRAGACSKRTAEMDLYTKLSAFIGVHRRFHFSFCRRDRVDQTKGGADGELTVAMSEWPKPVLVKEKNMEPPMNADERR
jgi:hypothetical protein